MARFKTNDPHGTPLYASQSCDHPIKILKYETEVFGDTLPVIGPHNRSIQFVTVVLDNSLHGWVYSNQLSNP